jgi:hypothetical protein
LYDFHNLPLRTSFANDPYEDLESKFWLVFQGVLWVVVQRCHQLTFNIFPGKIIDKKADMINGPKSHHPQVTSTQNAHQPQQQTPATQTIVNSTNNNSVSNNSRKSSETVTSDDPLPSSNEEEQPVPKAQSEEVTAPTVSEAAHALAVVLDEESRKDSGSESSSDEPQVEQHPPQLAPSSDTVNVDSSNSEEMSVICEKAQEATATEVKSEDESCKKVRQFSVILFEKF